MWPWPKPNPRPPARFSYWLCPWDGTPMESPSLNSDTHRCTKCGLWIDGWYPPEYGWKVEVTLPDDRAIPMDQLCVRGVWYVVWRAHIVIDGRWVGSKTRVWTPPG